MRFSELSLLYGIRAMCGWLQGRADFRAWQGIAGSGKGESASHRYSEGSTIHTMSMKYSSCQIDLTLSVNPSGRVENTAWWVFDKDI